MMDVKMTFDDLSIFADNGISKDEIIKAGERDALQSDVMDFISDGIFFKDAGGRYLACNKAFAEHVGRPKDQIINKTDYDIFPRERAEFNLRNNNFVLEGGVPHRTEKWFSKPNGDRLLVETSLSPYLQTDGRISGVVGIIRDISEYRLIEEHNQDVNAQLQQQVAERTEELLQVNRKLLSEITERKKTDDALRVSEERFRRIFETANEGIWVLDGDLCTVLVNRKMAEMLGYRVTDMINKKPQAFMFEEDVPEYEAKIALRMQGISEDLERRYRHADGHTVWFKISVSPFLDRLRTFQGTVAMFTDITERKQAEETLKIKDGAITSSISAIYFVDHEGFVTYANPACLSIFEIEKAEDVIGEHISAFCHDTEKMAEIDEALASKGSWIGEVQMMKKSGKTFDASLSLNLVRNEEGKPICIMGSFIDITKHKKMGEALKSSEKLYRSVIENIHDTFYRTDINGKLIMASPSGVKLLGYAYSCDMVGVDVESMFHMGSDDRDRMLAIIHEQGYVEDYELKLKRQDGSVVEVSVTSHKYYDDQGNELGIEGIIRDITERKRIEKTLRDSESKFRSLTERSASAIVIIKNRAILYCNPAFESITGYRFSDLSGMNYWDIIHSDSRTMNKDEVLSILEGRASLSRYEMKIQTKASQIKWLDLSTIQIKYEGEPAIMGQAFDITDRKLAEENLRQSEERYRNIIENIDDGYIENDLSGTVTFCNDSIIRLYGYMREEIVGKDNRFFTTPETSRYLYSVYNEIYRTGNPQKMLEYELFRKDGAICHVEASASLIRDVSGNPIGFRSVVRDVTERKKMETDKIKLTEQLYQAQKMEAIGTLAGGIAHDFNNLLMGIQGYASLMLLKTDKNFAHHDKLKAIEAKVQSGAELTRQLLGFSRTGSYEVTTASVNELIHNTVTMFGRTKKEIVIHEKYEENAWNADIDQSRIEQVLLNLYVNAWQAMPGGGHLYLETNNVVLDERYKKNFDVEAGRYIKISVTDSGIGMNEKTRERVFEPFFTTRNVGKGGGLGLATAYGIIRGHKGVINVYSERGHGTTFNIYLPASDKAVNTDNKYALKPENGQETVLIVDDEEYILDVTKELLECIGYHVMQAKSGEEALEIYRTEKNKIDLLILDMIMPGMSGSDTFDRLKKINPAVKVILASGYSLNGQAIGILDRGCQAFMQKPFGLMDLSMKIRDVLDMK